MKLLRFAGAALALALSTQACAHGRLVQLAVHDRAANATLPVYWHEGRAYVVGRPGNEYQVSVRSRGEEVLAVVSVDGVNVVTGETADAQQSGYVLGPGSATDIRGWRKSLQRVAAFYFTELPDSYAARTGRPENVGVIGVAVFRKKRADPISRPYAPAPAPFARRDSGEAREEAGAAAGSASSADAAGEQAGRSLQKPREATHLPKLGTGHGRDEGSQARYVNFERASSTPAEVVTLYYDSYRNLVARGVIRGGPAPSPLPRPFPGFVPDPA